MPKKKKSIGRKQNVRRILSRSVIYRDKRTGKMISKKKWAKLPRSRRVKKVYSTVLHRSKLTGRYIRRDKIRATPSRQLTQEFRAVTVYDKRMESLKELAEFFKETVESFDPQGRSFMYENYVNAATAMLQYPQEFTRRQLNAARRIVKTSQVSTVEKGYYPVKRKTRPS